VHVNDPAKIVNVGGTEPVEISALVNLITLNRGFTRCLDFDLHVVLGKVSIRRDVLVDYDVLVSAFLKNGLLYFDAQGVFVVANDGDFAPLPIFIEADDPEAGESDKCGS